MGFLIFLIVAVVVAMFIWGGGELNEDGELEMLEDEERELKWAYDDKMRELEVHEKLIAARARRAERLK